MRTSVPLERATSSADVQHELPERRTSPGLVAARRRLAVGIAVAAVVADLNLDAVSRGVLATLVGIVAWVAVAAAAIALQVGRRSRSTRRLRAHDWAFLLWLGFVGCSVLWSVSTRETVISVVPLGLLWFAAYLVRGVPSTDAVRAVALVAAVSAALSLALLALRSELAYQPFSSTGAAELRGIFRHQLRLGAFMALAVGLLVIARLRGDLGSVRTRSRALDIVAVVAIVGALILSRARLYPAEAALALGLTVLLSRRGWRKWAFLAAVALLVAILADRLDAILLNLEYSGFDTSLTGRNVVWERTLGGITRSNELLGYGFGTLDLPLFDYLFPGSYRAGNAHNSYLQAYFETGKVGLFALIGLVAVQLTAAWRYSVKHNRYSYSLFLVLYTALGSLTGLNYGGGLSAMLCLTIVFLAIETREGRPAPRPRVAVGPRPARSAPAPRDQVPHP